ncbi:hypothetical protein Tco_0509699, partial [Tanacetum coccineum]
MMTTKMWCYREGSVFGVIVDSDVTRKGADGGKKKKSNNNLSFRLGLDSGSTQLVDATGTIHMGTGSVNNLGNGGNGDGDSENAKQTCPNSASDGVVASPPILTPNPGKSSSYANVIGKPSRAKVNFHTLFTPRVTRLMWLSRWSLLELLVNDLLILHMVSSWESGWLTPLLLTMLGTLGGKYGL